MNQEESFASSTYKSPLNKSSAKAQFTFPKAERMIAQKVHNNEQIYDLPQVMSKRATSMGFGKKVDLGPKQFYPSPDKYNKNSEFQKSPHKGKSIGISRDSFKAISIFPNSKTPGPGQYQNKLRDSSKNYSMRGRQGFPQIFQKNDVPGPGKYQINDTTQKQFFFNSKQKSPKIYSIKPEHKQNNSMHAQIGPGKYETTVSSMGKQLLHKKKTQTAFIFRKEIRQVFEDKKRTPGPGSYTHFSEFGK